MNRGYVKLWRKSLDSGMIRNHKLWAFWSWCLLKASHQEMVQVVGFQEVNLHAGEFIFGRLKASKELGLSEREIRTCLDVLKKWGNVTIKTTNKFSIVSIVNWSTYQSEENANDHQNDQQPTSNRPQTRTKEQKNNTYSPNSLEVLAYLNQKTGRHYRDALHIEARLKDGGTVEQCKRIIDNKLKDEYFTDHPKYLNPETLFRKSHWDKYLNEPSERKSSPW